MMAQEIRMENSATNIVQCASIVQTTFQDDLTSCTYFDTNWDLMKQETEVEMEMGAFYIPKYNKDKPLGEDAYFLHQQGQSFGVADGVGGWTKKGIDAGEYARQLMENSLSTIVSHPNGYLLPKEVLIEAHSMTKLPGSSTACIVTLTHQILQYANIGDSGFMILRNGKNIYKSKMKQRKFNAPCHLGNGSRFTPPCEAIEGKFSVTPGDIIVAATDGLFDNMFEGDIELAVIKEREQGASPKKVAEALVKLALYNSLDQNFQSPFAKAAGEAGQDHKGGKKDDITVVIAFVQPQSDRLGLGLWLDL